jgi:hypothetical protein
MHGNNHCNGITCGYMLLLPNILTVAELCCLQLYVQCRGTSCSVQQHESAHGCTRRVQDVQHLLVLYKCTTRMMRGWLCSSMHNASQTHGHMQQNNLHTLNTCMIYAKEE